MSGCSQSESLSEVRVSVSQSHCRGEGRSSAARMADMNDLQNAEFKMAFDEFDTVRTKARRIFYMTMY